MEKDPNPLTNRTYNVPRKCHEECSTLRHVLFKLLSWKNKEIILQAKGFKKVPIGQGEGIWLAAEFYLAKYNVRRH